MMPPTCRGSAVITGDVHVRLAIWGWNPWTCPEQVPSRLQCGLEIRGVDDHQVEQWAVVTFEVAEVPQVLRRQFRLMQSPSGGWVRSVVFRQATREDEAGVVARSLEAHRAEEATDQSEEGEAVTPPARP